MLLMYICVLCNIIHEKNITFIFDWPFTEQNCPSYIIIFVELDDMMTRFSYLSVLNNLQFLFVVYIIYNG